jgi:hypothetical protein
MTLEVVWANAIDVDFRRREGVAHVTHWNESASERSSIYVDKPDIPVRQANDVVQLHVNLDDTE